MNSNDISDARRALADVEAARALFRQSDRPWSNKWHGREIRGRGREKLDEAIRLLDSLAARGNLPADQDCRRSLRAAKGEGLYISSALRHIEQAASELSTGIRAMEDIMRAETKVDAGRTRHLNDKPHREGAPAVIRSDGSELWCLNGKLHREGAPAVVRADGSELWYLNGKLHRKGGPAVVRADGSELWYLNGKLHRKGGPAVVRGDGSELWYLNGKLHRKGGPAVVRADGSKSWYRNGKLHRKGGPALVRADGSKSWYRNGKLHRKGGPAVIRVDGSELWYLNGKLHRTDGWPSFARMARRRGGRVRSAAGQAHPAGVPAPHHRSG